MPETYAFDFVPDTLGHLLSDQRLSVPIYQRSYAWTSTEIDEYISDLSAVVGSTDVEYFIGNIVVSTEGAAQAGFSAIIDGQQRLATTAMLAAALRDEFKVRGDSKRASIVHATYLADADLASADDLPRLHLNSEDDPVFNKLVVQGRSPDDSGVTKESHQRLADGYAQLRAHVSEEAKAAGSAWEKRLVEWLAFLQKGLRIVLVTVPTESDAFLVFETLNDRGADLTIADLLKNYLFRLSGGSIDVVRDNWVSAVSNLGISAENELFTTFLRHSWSSRHGSTRERELYQSIKSTIKTEVRATELSIQLVDDAKTYAAMLNSDHDFWSGHGATAKANVETLLRLDLEQQRPLLLSIMQHFTGSGLRAALKCLVRWSVRGLIVGGIGGGKTEKAYCAASLKVRSSSLSTVTGLLADLSTIVPSDEQFEAAFKVARVTKASLARYLLLTLERAVKGDVEPELVPNSNYDEVNLEHVLPKKATSAEWPTFTKEEHQLYLHRVGNLALLQKGPNDRIGNKPFSDKKPVLSASVLSLTSSVGAEATWSPAEVDKRQVALAKLALSAWPRGA